MIRFRCIIEAQEVGSGTVEILRHVVSEGEATGQSLVLEFLADRIQPEGLERRRERIEAALESELVIAAGGAVLPADYVADL